jgi:hypothetical protein
MRIPHIFHGIETGTETTAPKRGEPMQPVGNDLWVELAASGNGAVNATVQMKGRIDALSALQNIGSPVTVSGTAAPGAPVTGSFQVNTGARFLYADLTACSVLSFRAVGSEADR